MGKWSHCWGSLKIPLIDVRPQDGLAIYKGYLLVLGKEPETALRKGVLYPKPTITARCGPTTVDG